MASVACALLGLLFVVCPVSAAERVVLVAGGGTDTNSRVALAPTQARLSSPFGVASDAAGNLYVVEMTGERVRRIDPSGKLTVIAGTGRKGSGGDGGPALEAEFNGMHNLAVSASDALFVADTWNNRVRKIDLRSGRITTLAGTGEKGYSGDGGPALEARFGGIYCASLDPRGDELVVADLDNLRIRAINLKTGRVRLVAGNGKKGVPADGARASEAPLVDPRAVIVARTGQVYLLERGGHALRVVEPDGAIKTVVGVSGKAGHSGDGGEGRLATLNGPKHLCEDRDGSILIADTENHVIRRYTPRDGRLARVAGTGKKGSSGLDGPPLQVELNQPHGVFVHPDGSLCISDSSNHRVLKVERVR